MTERERMAIYEIDIVPDAHDPQDWADCQVIRSIPSLGNTYYLVDISLSAVNKIRKLRGVVKVGPAPDGDDFVDDAGRTFVVRGGERVGLTPDSTSLAQSRRNSVISRGCAGK
jgi:hypothetical protein